MKLNFLGVMGGRDTILSERVVIFVASSWCVVGGEGKMAVVIVRSDWVKEGGGAEGVAFNRNW